MAQQRVGSGVDIHPYGVDAIFHHAGQRLVQFGFGHVMLVLADANGLGIDFDQFCQRVLQTPGNGNGGAQGYIVLGKFLRRQLGGGIDGSAGFADHHVRDFLRDFPQQLGHKDLRFVGGGTVANGDDGDAVFLDELFTGFLGRPDFILRRGRIDYRSVKHFSVFIHHR